MLSSQLSLIDVCSFSWVSKKGIVATGCKMSDSLCGVAYADLACGEECSFQRSVAGAMCENAWFDCAFVTGVANPLVSSVLQSPVSLRWAPALWSATVAG
jgi:hypothetical protein